MASILINIDVPDIEKAVAFYTSALPLRVGRRFDSEFVELIGLPSPIYLLEKKSGTFPFPGSKQTRSYEQLSMYRDPFGHGLCLIQFSENGYDELLR